MDETQKPFACTAEGCTMSFTNLDHLNVHTKKHAMSLQLSLGNKTTAFVADQTPTPTRLIRNCDEVGLFDDLHLHPVNPFEETFRQAVESKHGSSMTPTLDHNTMMMDDTLAQDETTLHTPNVLPFYLTNCTFKEESITTMGEDVIAGGQSDTEEPCTFKVDVGGATGAPDSDKVIDDDAESKDSRNICCDKTVATTPVDVKMEEIIVIDTNKPRPPALILSKSPSSLSSNFKKIVDETLSDEPSPVPTSQPITQTIVVKPLPKLTRILPMIPHTTTTTARIVKFDTTPKLLKINLNDPGKRLLLPKSKSLDEKTISVKDKLKATLLKTHAECETVVQPNVKRVAKPVINDKTVTKKDDSDKSDDKMKVSRNRAAAKRYRNKLKMWHNDTKQRNVKLEEENNKLRAEVRQLKSLLLAHQDCSVAKAMALGKHIPIGLPKMIVKDQNSEHIAIINDVTMNPVYLLMNKPVEYNSTVSIS